MVYPKSARARPGSGHNEKATVTQIFSSEEFRRVQGQTGKSLVIVGLGYVGLPLCRVFSSEGFKVSGVDSDHAKLEMLLSGKSPVSVLTDSELGTLFHEEFKVYSDFSPVSNADVILLALPTPIGENREPDLSALVGALSSIAKHLSKKSLIVIESTVGPGTTVDTLLPHLEHAGKELGTDFLLAFSPERVDPGGNTGPVQHIPKIVAGVDPESHAAAVEFYQSAGFTVVESHSVAEAEAAKLLENTYRAVNMALVNELAPALSAMGLDIAEVVRLAATKPFGFQPFFPGAGVGGHCIPIDPWYLESAIQKVGGQSRITRMALLVNEDMPRAVAKRIAHLLEYQPKQPGIVRDVLLLGMTYKPNVDDFRESPGPKVALALHDLGLSVGYHDPFLEKSLPELNGLPTSSDFLADVSAYRAVVVLQDHEQYEPLRSHDRPALWWASADSSNGQPSLWGAEAMSAPVSEDVAS